MMTTPTIGLCGGIGAGKSRVAAEFGRQGCVVISSDELGREVSEQPDVLAQLQDWWGEGVVNANGGLNRAEVARIVFAAPEERRRLEALLHPLIAARRRAIIQQVEGLAGTKAVCLDSPLLLESNLAHECDAVVFVETSFEERLRRLLASRGWDASELQRRERWQLPIDQKRRRADFVINNDGPPEALRDPVGAVLAAVLSGPRRC